MTRFEEKLVPRAGRFTARTEHEPPPGMLLDGTLNIVEENSPKQEPTIRLTRKLTRTIVLTGGPRTRLETLQDAATLIHDLDPFQQARPVWDRAGEMILLAATTGKRADIGEATRQLLVALGHENWWKA